LQLDRYDLARPPGKGDHRGNHAASGTEVEDAVRPAGSHEICD
jgi:hypothetical protein